MALHTGSHLFECESAELDLFPPPPNITESVISTGGTVLFCRPGVEKSLTDFRIPADLYAPAPLIDWNFLPPASAGFAAALSVCHARSTSPTVHACAIAPDGINGASPE